MECLDLIAEVAAREAGFLGESMIGLFKAEAFGSGARTDLAICELRGPPVLLNTSFNENEPIVDTP